MAILEKHLGDPVLVAGAIEIASDVMGTPSEFGFMHDLMLLYEEGQPLESVDGEPAKSIPALGVEALTEFMPALIFQARHYALEREWAERAPSLIRVTNLMRDLRDDDQA
jgi:hypothetical protein